MTSNVERNSCVILYADFGGRLFKALPANDNGNDERKEVYLYTTHYARLIIREGQLIEVDDSSFRLVAGD